MCCAKAFDFGVVPIVYFFAFVSVARGDVPPYVAKADVQEIVQTSEDLRRRSSALLRALGVICMAESEDSRA